MTTTSKSKLSKQKFHVNEVTIFQVLVDIDYLAISGEKILMTCDMASRCLVKS